VSGTATQRCQTRDSPQRRGRPSKWRCAITALLIGYARCLTDEQDLTGQRVGLAVLGVTADRTYVADGLTGCDRERPGVREALATCREGDALLVTKLHRLARSPAGRPGDRR
jgi:hypothetical protein